MYLKNGPDDFGVYNHQLNQFYCHNHIQRTITGRTTIYKSFILKLEHPKSNSCKSIESHIHSTTHPPRPPYKNYLELQALPQTTTPTCPISNLQHHPPTTATMICTRCLRISSSSSLRTQSLTKSTSSLIRPFSSSSISPSPASTPATSLPGLAQPFSTPLTPSPSSTSPQAKSATSKKGPTIVSSCPAGTPLKGLNYLKGRDDPVALAEEEYPEWLWTCLDKKEVEGEDGGAAGDEFCEF